MKTMLQFISLIALLAYLSPSMASGVFKCTGSNGEMTFSFTPCATAVPVSVDSPRERRSRAPRLEKLARVESDIARIEEELQDTKREFEHSLRVAGSADRRNQITSAFDESSGRLILELNKLQGERERLGSF